ncbi:MAG: ComF family protein [Candidatus Dormibacteria bacterium]
MCALGGGPRVLRGVLRHEGPVRHAVQRLKYGDRPALADALAELWLEWSELPGGSLVPVPLHAARLRHRGYNQAALLARALGRAQGREVVEGLARLRATEPQVGRGGEARRRALPGAFEWVGKLPPPGRVVLVDDVLTTGSTLLAAAAALGARSEVVAMALTQA